MAADPDTVVAATVAVFAVPEPFGILVTDPEVGPVPDFSNFSYVTAGGRVHLTDDPARDAGGAWSSDCSRIAFTSNREGSIGSHGDIYTMNSDGTDIANLTRSPRDDFEPAWSPDGSRIAFASESEGQLGHLRDEHRRHRPDQAHRYAGPQPDASVVPRRGADPVHQVPEPYP